MMKILQNDCNLWNTEFHTLLVRWSPVITTVLNQSRIKRIFDSFLEKISRWFARENEIVPITYSNFHDFKS